jgi:Ni/Fe-hydrogenase subunit HybB-like protein
METETTTKTKLNPMAILPFLLILIGLGAFGAGILGDAPQRAWQAYLIGFLLFSAIAQGAVLFPVVMHLTKARWSGPLSRLSAAFAAFFPLSLVLFVVLFFGARYLFPWLEMDLHGKEVWLNLPFLFGRDFLGLCLLYGLGIFYLYYDLGPQLGGLKNDSRLGRFFYGRWANKNIDGAKIQKRKSLLAVLYALAYVLVLSLIGYDLVMAADPHWYSTLFGAYNFVKAFYAGLGALIISAAILQLNPNSGFSLHKRQFHDLGKLFFAFCLVWADFFYCQLVVIWYGNIPEESAYVIERTMHAPWQPLAWFIFLISFGVPFVVLINRKIKTKPRLMALLCTLVILGLWLEHLLLLGPPLNPNTHSLPLGLSDGLIFLGFLGLMAFAIRFFLNSFPLLFKADAKEPR